MTQTQCPNCGQFEISQIVFRVDPDTGEQVKRPTSWALALLVSAALGIFSAVMLWRYGFGTGCGLWVFGLTAAIAIPVVVRDQHKTYKRFPRGAELVCDGCGERWEADPNDAKSWVERVPKTVWRLLRWPPRILYSLGLGPLYGRFVLLLTTTGRKTGLPRMIPVQYEEIDGSIYIGAARGVQADWFRNIQAHPAVEVRLKSSRFRAIAEPITDLDQIADFLELRLKRHPRMMAIMLRMEGLSAKPTREQLEAYAARRAMVRLRPEDDVQDEHGG